MLFPEMLWIPSSLFPLQTQPNVPPHAKYNDFATRFFPSVKLEEVLAAFSRLQIQLLRFHEGFLFSSNIFPCSSSQKSETAFRQLSAKRVNYVEFVSDEDPFKMTHYLLKRPIDGAKGKDKNFDFTYMCSICESTGDHSDHLPRLFLCPYLGFWIER
jgi:hypothetical protein